MNTPIDTMGNTRPPSLFSSDEDWWHNACLNWRISNWDAYAAGYKEAADVLASHLSASRATLDTVVYPLVFLYRQYLELRLKYLVGKGRRLLDVEGSKRLDHRLPPLWAELRATAETLWPNEGKHGLDEIEEYLRQFAEIDPASFAFRYPETKKGEPTLAGLTHINIRRLAEAMDQVSILLEGMDCCLSQYLEYRSDCERAMRDY